MKKGKALPWRCLRLYPGRTAMAAADPDVPPPAEPLYPAIEGFLETATQADLDALFASVKDSLTALQGPRAEYRARVEKAVARTEELLQHLLQVRARLEEKATGGRKEPPRRNSR
jgi:hypothetical protein